MTTARKPDGGPMFPQASGFDIRHRGMTVRDWFAAHAPAEPHHLWLRPKFEPQPQRPEGATLCPGCDAAGCDAGGDCDGGKAGEACRALGKWADECAQWRWRKTAFELAAWRYAYADALIAARGDSDHARLLDSHKALTFVAAEALRWFELCADLVKSNVEGDLSRAVVSQKLILDQLRQAHASINSQLDQLRQAHASINSQLGAPVPVE